MSYSLLSRKHGLQSVLKETLDIRNCYGNMGYKQLLRKYELQSIAKKHVLQSIVKETWATTYCQGNMGYKQLLRKHELQSIVKIILATINR